MRPTYWQYKGRLKQSMNDVYSRKYCKESCYYSLWIIVLLSCCSIYAQDTLLINQEYPVTSLSQHVEYYIDSDQNQSIRDVYSLTEHWHSHSKDKLFFSPQNAHHWVSFSVKNIGSESMNAILNIAYAHVANYKIYEVDKDGNITQSEMHGDNYPFKQREIYHPHFIHSINLNASESKTIILFFDQEGQDLQLPLFLSSEKRFFENDHNTRLITGFSFGLSMIVILGLIGLYFFYKAKYILLQVFTSISSMYYVVAEEGYGFMYLWSDFPIMNGISRPLFLGFVAVFSLLFTLDLLQVRESIHSRLYHSIFLMMGFYIIYILAAHPLFLIPIYSEYNIAFLISTFLLLTLVLFVINLSICIYHIFLFRNTDAYILTGIFSLLVIALSIRTLSFHGLSSSHFLISHTGIFTLTLQTILIGFYLFYKTLQIIKQNQKISIQIAEERQSASESIIDSLHQERERISMDIHDSLTSLVTAAKMNLEALPDEHQHLHHDKKYQTSINLLKDISYEMRAISHNLMPKTLQTFGLKAELYKRANDIQASHDITITLEDYGFDNRLPERIEIELYHISMEVIDNVIKYSKAKHLLIQCNVYDDEVNIIYEDDGIGFDIKKLSPHSNGITNIKNRTKWLNGQIDIDSIKGVGTTITINIPVVITAK